MASAGSTNPDAPAASHPELQKRLKEALQYAKSLFDDSLINEAEHRRLREFELARYQTESDALAAPAGRGRGGMLPDTSDTSDAAAGMSTPPERVRVRRREGAPYSAPQCRKRPRDVPRERGETLYVEPGVYSRLFTPPILRRRPRALRRVRVPASTLRDVVAPEVAGAREGTTRRIDDTGGGEGELPQTLWKSAQALVSLSTPKRARRAAAAAAGEQ